MDRRAILAIALSFVVLFGSNWLFQKLGWLPTPSNTKVATAPLDSSSAPGRANLTAPTLTTLGARDTTGAHAGASGAWVATDLPDTVLTIEQPLFTARVRTRGARLLSVVSRSKGRQRRTGALADSPALSLDLGDDATPVSSRTRCTRGPRAPMPGPGRHAHADRARFERTVGRADVPLRRRGLPHRLQRSDRGAEPGARPQALPHRAALVAARDRAHARRRFGEPGRDDEGGQGQPASPRERAQEGPEDERRCDPLARSAQQVLPARARPRRGCPGHREPHRARARHAARGTRPGRGFDHDPAAGPGRTHQFMLYAGRSTTGVQRLGMDLEPPRAFAFNFFAVLVGALAWSASSTRSSTTGASRSSCSHAAKLARRIRCRRAA